MTISENFEHFQYSNLETDFLKNENLFQKLAYHFLVKSTKIENASFSCKTAISEANVKTNSTFSYYFPVSILKTNRMVSTKYHKE